MATVTLYPTASAAVVSPGFAGNTANAYSASDSNAVATAAGIVVKNTTSSTDFKGFDFSSIPAGSTITSVTPEVRWRVQGTAAAMTLTAQLYAAGALRGTQLANAAEPTTLTAQSAVAVAGLTRANLDANTAVRVETKQGNATTSVISELEYVRIVVVYTAPVVLTDSIAASGGDVVAFVDAITKYAPQVLSDSAPLVGAGVLGAVDGFISSAHTYLDAAPLAGSGVAVFVDARVPYVPRVLADSLAAVGASPFGAVDTRTAYVARVLADALAAGGSGALVAVERVTLRTSLASGGLGTLAAVDAFGAYAGAVLVDSLAATGAGGLATVDGVAPYVARVLADALGTSGAGVLAAVDAVTPYPPRVLGDGLAVTGAGALGCVDLYVPAGAVVDALRASGAGAFLAVDAFTAYTGATIADAVELAGSGALTAADRARFAEGLALAAAGTLDALDAYVPTGPTTYLDALALGGAGVLDLRAAAALLHLLDTVEATLADLGLADRVPTLDVVEVEGVALVAAELSDLTIQARAEP